jgi:hypothetical protein
MSPDRNELDLLLNQIEENCSPSQYASALLPFMFECANLVADRMPKIALDSLAIGRSFAAGGAVAGSLDDAIQASWKALDKGPNGLQPKEPEVSAIRLVICILHRLRHPGSDDFVDLASFFLQLVNNIEPSSERLEGLIRKWFLQCL